MNAWDTYVGQVLESGLASAPHLGRLCVASYGDIKSEYHALADGPAVVDRSYRALIDISGADRASWLHNLTTNEVKNLSAGEGHYAFALNVQGRILFDLNICVREASICLDLDGRVLDTALLHLGKYIIVEDVTLVDRSKEFVRFGLSGNSAKAALSNLGAGHASLMPLYGTADLKWNGCDIAVIRTDFAGVFGVEMLVPSDRSVDYWKQLTDASGPVEATPVGDQAMQVRRIEAGLPWPSREISDRRLPAETGQSDRAVSFTKGCYLGQEVVERMRSRGALAYQLVGFRFDGDEMPPMGATIQNDKGAAMGEVTSVCHSMALRSVIGLGYVKTSFSPAGISLQCSWPDGSVQATVVDLPFVPPTERERSGR